MDHTVIARAGNEPAARRSAQIMGVNVKDTTSVLVVGGSLVGLSAGMFLGWNGVSTVVVEKHASSSEHPRAIGYTRQEQWSSSALLDWLIAYHRHPQIFA